MEFHQRMFVVRFEYITKVNIGDEIFSQPCIIFDRKYHIQKINKSFEQQNMKNNMVWYNFKKNYLKHKIKYRIP